MTFCPILRNFTRIQKSRFWARYLRRPTENAAKQSGDKYFTWEDVWMAADFRTNMLFELLRKLNGKIPSQTSTDS